MSEKKVKVKLRVGLTSSLFLIFLVLKLTEVVTWSWWWVFAPIWIPFVIIALIGCTLALTEIFSKD